MSLINEALKKAQRQRMEGSAPPPPEAPADSATGAGPRVAKRGKPTDFRSQLLLLAGGGLAVICVLAVAGFFLLRPKSSEAPANPAPNVTSPVRTPVAVATPAAPTPRPPESSGTLPAANQVTVTAPVVNTPAAPVSVTPPASAPVVTLPAPAPAVTPSPEPPKPAEKLKPSPRMIAIIEALKVAGIRAAGAESKVLMNDRVFRLNDTIEHELNIRLTVVTANSLTFEDERGATYTRNF